MKKRTKEIIIDCLIAVITLIFVNAILFKASVVLTEIHNELVLRRQLDAISTKVIELG